jgi:hypothetical protein
VRLFRNNTFVLALFLVCIVLNAVAIQRGWYL